MGRLYLKPGDEVKMLVWKAFPGSESDMPWRAAPAVNGCVVNFGERFSAWRHAMAYAWARVQEGVL